MSTHPTQALPSPAFSGPAARRAVQSSSTGLTLTGVVLFLIGVLVVASGYVALRPKIMGVSLHAALVPIGLAFPFVLLSRGNQFPMRVMVGLIAFAGIYAFSVVNGASIALNEIVKIGSTFAAIITCALLVRSRADFVAGCLGLAIGVAVLGIPGLRAASGTLEGVEVLEGANKNTYSMFALPCILLAGYIYLNMPITRLVKWALVGCATICLLVIFMSANRSGYVGAALVALMLFWNRRGRGLILVAMVGAVVAGWVVYSGNTAAFERRLKQTNEGTSSDESRVALVIGAFQIALENPIVGVSPQKAPEHLARAAAQITGRHRMTAFGAHNVFAHVAAGSGLICFGALLFLGWAMWNPTPKDAGWTGRKDDPVRPVRQLLRMMVVLWVIRGMFTHEIHFNICFNITFGLILGLYILAERERTAMSRPGVIGRQPALT